MYPFEKTYQNSIGKNTTVKARNVKSVSENAAIQIVQERQTEKRNIFSEIAIPLEDMEAFIAAVTNEAPPEPCPCCGQSLPKGVVPNVKHNRKSD